MVLGSLADKGIGESAATDFAVPELGEEFHRALEECIERPSMVEDIQVSKGGACICHDYCSANKGEQMYNKEIRK